MKPISRLCHSLLLFTLFSLLSSEKSYAQTEQASFSQSVSLGVRGGMTASRFIFIPSVRLRLHTGPVVGISARYDVERGASLQAELNYRRGGWQERYDPLHTSYSRHLDYLELPLLTHLYLRSDDLNFFVNAGPFFGYLLGESASIEGEANMSTTDITRHGIAARDRLFWGLGGGPGISLALGERQRIELEGRFVYGLGNLWSTKRGSTYVQSSEMYFGATLNYFFRL